MSVKFNFALDLLLLFLIRREKSEFGRQIKVASLGVKGVHPRYFVKLVFKIAVADKLGPLSRLLRGSKPQPPTVPVKITGKIINFALNRASIVIRNCVK